MSPLVAIFCRRWRYTCPVCHWAGWKRRMRRTDRISVAADPAGAAPVSDTSDS